MPWRAWACWRAVRRFRGYSPQPVTFKSVRTWLSQFSRSDHSALLRLLSEVLYFSEEDTRAALVDLNRRLLDRLQRAGISPQNVIYVSIDEAGSSSHLMLNMLRDADLLEGRGCNMCDSRDILKMQKLMNKLEEGAIVYVDDFAGTGDQFAKSRANISQYIVGNFTEIFLLPCICEEAAKLLGSNGVEPMYTHLHTASERPLHEANTAFPQAVKSRLQELCAQVVGRPGGGLGYHRMATMVVFYRNATNHVPAVLRGDKHQEHYRGIVPRITDLPCPD